MDLEPIVSKPEEFKPGTRKLDALSVDDLRAYIADMKSEIARVEAAIEAKQAFRSRAEAVFKT
ncbi:MAG: DUF1192 domain-containing protein [Alphaproteobacteria bacterium]